ncbi:hypothetical protein, conserved, partial [Eimeria tenella]
SGGPIDRELAEEELQQQRGFRELQETAAQLSAQVEALKEENDNARQGENLLLALVEEQLLKCCSRQKRRTDK